MISRGCISTLLLFFVVSGSLADTFNSVYWDNLMQHRREQGMEACYTGRRQSPIDLPMEGNIQVRYDKLQFQDYDVTLTSEQLTNNGHTVKLSFYSNATTDSIPSLTGGGLGSEFKFAQLHFHWGSNDEVGSEHTIGKHSYPLELHLVHYNSRYGSDLLEAINHSNESFDTLAVLGIMFNLTEKDNEAMKPLVDNLERISLMGEQVNVESVPLEKLIPINAESFYRYSGSLTTPNCNEIVLWTVFKEPIPISQRQMKKFRELSMDKEGKQKLVNTFRSIQPLHGRQIYDASPLYSSSSKKELPSLAGIVAYLFLARLVI